MYDVSVELMSPGGLRKIQSAADMRFPLDRFLAGITERTKLMIVASPNNPTGATVPREDLLTIAKAAPHAVLMVDEAYFHFHGETTLPDVSTVPNLLVTRTFSKAYGLANLRVGMVAGDARLIGFLRKASSPYNVNGVALECLPAALADDAYIAWYVEQIRQGRARMTAALDDLGVPYFPSEALTSSSCRLARNTRNSSPPCALMASSCATAPQTPAATASFASPSALRTRSPPALKPSGSASKRSHGPVQSQPMTTQPSSHRSKSMSDTIRTSTINRNTTETQIALALTIDGEGRYTVSTGIRFFDHMLELFTRHGGFDLTLKVTGDLEVDQHHTVEDTGIALGEAFLEALGDKKGIMRAGYFVMPMDETLAVAAIDLSGRTAYAVETEVDVPIVGDLQTELVTDFFEGFARGARCNVHVKTMYGRSNHHKIEAIFKAFARALRGACSRDERMREMLPSTKGLL